VRLSSSAADASVTEFDVHPHERGQVVWCLRVEAVHKPPDHAFVEASLGGHEDEGSIDELDVLEEVRFAVRSVGG
jgi:hypothetical protein